MFKKGHDFFGNFFDLNGDGKTDAVETAMMFAMFDEEQEEERRQQEQLSSPSVTDLDDISLDDYTTDLDDLDIEGI